MCGQEFQMSISIYNLVVKGLKEQREYRLRFVNQLQQRFKGLQIPAELMVQGWEQSKGSQSLGSLKIQCYDMNEKNKCWLRRSKELTDRNLLLYNLIEAHLHTPRQPTSLATKTKKKTHIPKPHLEDGLTQKRERQRRS
jgi:hypothetical protein